MGTGDGYPRLGSPGREKDSPKYKHRKAQMGFRSYLWRVYLWEAQIQCNSTIKFACGSPCSNITVPIIICLISNYSAPALEYNPVRHPLFPDKSALQAFPRCTPKLIRKSSLLHLPNPQLLDSATYSTPDQGPSMHCFSRMSAFICNQLQNHESR
jgi:hypothetical protein